MLTVPIIFTERIFFAIYNKFYTKGIKEIQVSARLRMSLFWLVLSIKQRLCLCNDASNSDTEDRLHIFFQTDRKAGHWVPFSLRFFYWGRSLYTVQTCTQDHHCNGRSIYKEHARFYLCAIHSCTRRTNKKQNSVYVLGCESTKWNRLVVDTNNNLLLLLLSIAPVHLPNPLRHVNSFWHFRKTALQDWPISRTKWPPLAENPPESLMRIGASSAASGPSAGSSWRWRSTSPLKDYINGTQRTWERARTTNSIQVWLILTLTDAMLGHSKFTRARANTSFEGTRNLMARDAAVFFGLNR